MAILFHDEKIQSNLKRRRDLKSWIRKVLESEGRIPGDINIILTNDKNLQEINVKFLSRNYYTDIITFDYSRDNRINGDLYISLDRIKENAATYEEVEAAAVASSDKEGRICESKFYLGKHLLSFCPLSHERIDISYVIIWSADST